MDKAFFRACLILFPVKLRCKKIVVNVEPGIFFVVSISYLKFILDLRNSKVLLVFPAGRTG